MRTRNRRDGDRSRRQFVRSGAAKRGLAMDAWKLFQSPLKRTEFAKPGGHVELREDLKFPFACFPCASFHLTRSRLYVTESAYWVLVFIRQELFPKGTYGPLRRLVPGRSGAERTFPAFSCLAPEGASACVLHGRSGFLRRVQGQKGGVLWKNGA